MEGYLMLLLYRRVLLPPSTPYLLCCFRVSNCALVCFCLWFIELRLFEVFDMAGSSAPTPLHPSKPRGQFHSTRDNPFDIVPIMMIKHSKGSRGRFSRQAGTTTCQMCYAYQILRWMKPSCIPSYASSSISFLSTLNFFDFPLKFHQTNLF